MRRVATGFTSIGVLAVLIGLFFLVMQAFVLPPDGFMSGDQGSKYLQTRAFADHGPLNPSIDIRARDIDPTYVHQEPKLKNRRGRLVSEFMWLLPLLASPFLALLGLRGLYVVSALSAMVVFLCAARLARRADDPDGAVTALIVLLVTPIAVYGLELWEHAPAAACVMVMAVLLNETRDGMAEAKGPSRLRLFMAGVVAIAAFLFREEAAVALPALFLARALTRSPGLKTRPTAEQTRPTSTFVAEALWCGLGVVVGLIASAPMNLMMYGAPLPMHLTQDAWEYAKNISYLQVRRDIVMDLFLPGRYPLPYAVALVAGVAASISAARLPGLKTRPTTEPRQRTALAIVHASVAVMLAVAVALPLARFVSGAEIYDAYAVESAAHTWAFVPALLYLPWLGNSDRTPHARYLILSAVFALVFTSLVVPSTAGAQWSPRFYLQIAPLLAIPGVQIAWRPGSGGPRPGVVGALWGAHAALIASMLILVTGIVYLDSAKTRFANVTRGLARLTVDGEVVISDVFWVPEVTATLAPTRRFLFSWNPDDIPMLAQVAIGTGLERFSLVTYALQTHHTAPDAIDVPGARCRYVRGEHQFGLEIRGLVLSRYSCETP